MSQYKYLLVLLLVLTVFGCVHIDPVYSTKPIGEESSEVKSEEWDGMWLDQRTGSILSIKVKDEEGGVLEIRLIGGGTSNDEIFDVFLRRSERWMFGSIPETGQELHYIWFRVEHSLNMVMVWFPDRKKISALIKSGKLPGKVEEVTFYSNCANEISSNDGVTFYSNCDTVREQTSKEDFPYLGDLTPEHLKILTSEAEGVLYYWDRPRVYTRINYTRENH